MSSTRVFFIAPSTRDVRSAFVIAWPTLIRATNVRYSRTVMSG